MTDDELANLETAANNARGYVSIRKDLVLALIAALREARAKIERMRPVVSAACAFDDTWARMGDDFTMDTTRAADTLLHAIDTYRAGGKT